MFTAQPHQDPVNLLTISDTFCTREICTKVDSGEQRTVPPRTTGARLVMDVLRSRRIQEALSREKKRYPAARRAEASAVQACLDAAQGATREESEDKLDDKEQFDKLEMERIVSQDPDALAFFQAQKTRRANLTQNRTHLRQMHRNKRA